MKYFYIPFIFLLLACNGNNKKSDAYGNFEAIEIMVSAETPGRLTELSVDAGSVLNSGDIAGKIDSTQNFLRFKQLQASKNSLFSRLASAEAQVRAAQAQLNSLQKEKTRIEKLFRDSAATQQQYDDVAGRYEVLKAQSQVASAQVQTVQSESDVLENQIKQAKDMLLKCNIINPVNGTVLERYADKGELVGAGVPIYKIADLTYLNLRAYVSGSQLASIKQNQEVSVLIDNNKHSLTELKGIVTWISSQAEFTPKIIQTKEERVNLVYAIKVRVKNNGALKIGMPGEVRFSLK